MGTVNLVMRSPDDDKKAADVEARPGELFGAAAESQREKEAPQDLPGVKAPVAPAARRNAEAARHVDHAGS